MMAQDLTPLDLSDEDLEILAEITDQDLITAQQFIAKALDPKYRNLLLAEDQELVESEDNPNE